MTPTNSCLSDVWNFQAAQAERKRASAAQAKLDTAASSDSSSKTSATAVPGTGTAWPATQQQQSGAVTKAFTKQGVRGGVLVGAAAGGPKKKMVIKLKKKP